MGLLSIVVKEAAKRSMVKTLGEVAANAVATSLKIVTPAEYQIVLQNILKNVIVLPITEYSIDLKASM